MNIGKWKAWIAGYAKGNGAEAGLGLARASPPARDLVFGSLIMMVDDEPSSLEVTQIQLEDAGFTRFLTTSEPAGAVAIIKKQRPDLLLLDLMMPGVSGFDILAHMEADNILKDVPTIVLTSSSDGQSRLRALELGITEFLLKPVDPVELVLRVSNTLAAKAYWRGCWAPQ